MKHMTKQNYSIIQRVLGQTQGVAAGAAPGAAETLLSAVAVIDKILAKEK
jgi:hypothetical protein